MIQETYRLLAVGVFSAMAAGWFAARSLAVVKFFLSPLGWITAMLALNFLPRMALGAMRSGKGTGAMVLALDGAISGVVLAPLLYVAMLVSGNGDNAPNLVQAALIITAAVFGGITLYVHRSGAQFNFLSGMMNGMFWVLMAAMVVNVWFLHSALGMLILIGIGALGCAQLVWATGQVLNNPEYDEPVVGALILFAGLFNLFQVILSVLLRSRD